MAVIPKLKITRYNAYNIAWSPHTYLNSNWGITKQIWDKNPSMLIMGISEIGAVNLDNEQGYTTGGRKKEAETTRKNLQTNYPKIWELINNTILTQNAITREAYANTDWADPNIIDIMKTDPNRKIINAVAGNYGAHETTRYYLHQNHKSPGLQEKLAYTTLDINLLQMINNRYPNNQQVQRRIRQNELYPQLNK